MSKVVISTDSTSDLSPELIEKYGIRIMPLTVVLENDIRTDGVDVTPQDLFDFVDETGELPKTSAVTLAVYTDFFREMEAQGNEVVHIGLSSNFSSCVQNAHISSAEFKNVYVVDSYNLSTGSGLLVVEAAEMAAKGMSASDIARAIEKLVADVDASFVIDAVPYLHKGGRCSSVAAIGANILKIKPGIEVKNGSMVVGKKYRGTMQDVVRAYVKDRLAIAAQGCKHDRAFVTHTCVHPELVEIVMKAAVASGLFNEVIETKAGSTIASHCGPDTIGLLFIRA